MSINGLINVNLEPKLLDILNMVADKKHCSISSLSRELIIEALERREDLALCQIADLRDNEPDTDHDNAW